jgi:hypothetical protein
MRRGIDLASYHIQRALYSVKIGEDEDEQMTVRYDTLMNRWQVRDSSGSSVIVESSTLEGLDTALKAYQRKLRNAPFQRVRVIVCGRWGADPWVGTVTSWVMGENKRSVWVVRDDDGSGKTHKHKVSVEELRVFDEAEYETYLNLAVDLGLLHKKMRLESKRLAETLPKIEFDEKKQPYLG